MHEPMLIVTGMSGAGKTEVMKSLEDLGFFCIDNLPPPLLPELSRLPDLSPGEAQRVAVAMDVRGRSMFAQLLAAVDGLRGSGVGHRILFLDCADDVLVRRYSETRRRHPVTEGQSLYERIAAERAALAAIRERADLVLDTTRTRAHELKLRLGQLVLGRGTGLDLEVEIISFGFKNGVPLDADLMFDARFLKNPHYEPDLRLQTGLDQPVADFVLSQPEAGRFVDSIVGLLEHWIPLHATAGKTRLTVAIGCTGGQHRSVAVTERIAARLAQSFDPVRPVHRDIRRAGA